jgi:outer membrane lipoprotein-sorting protein
MKAFALALLSLAAWPARAADPSAGALLAQIDHAMNSFRDGVFELKLRLKQPDGKTREYAFTTYQKVPNKRLVRFSAPGDVKGMGLLVENLETMYVFLPGFQRVRRMGTHVKNQSFMGSDFSFEDMSEIAYGNSYVPRLLDADDKSWIVELTAKRGLDLEYPTIKMWVDKVVLQPIRTEYYDASGRKQKTQLRVGYAKDSPQHYSPAKVVNIDHRRNDHTSEVVFISTKIDQGLPDELFSVRSLMRGP